MFNVSCDVWTCVTLLASTFQLPTGLDLRRSSSRGSPQKHVWRARIVLLTANGMGTVTIMAVTGKSKTCV